jgi:hypothetical protein
MNLSATPILEMKVKQMNSKAVNISRWDVYCFWIQEFSFLFKHNELVYP